MELKKLNSDWECDNVLKYESIVIYLIAIAISIYFTYQNHESIICTEVYCYAHRHSIFCYIFWALINAAIVYFACLIWLLTIKFPVFYNAWIFIRNRFVPKPKKEPKDLKNVLTMYNRYFDGRRND